MLVVISHSGPGMNVYGPFDSAAAAEGWGRENLGVHNPFWSVEVVRDKALADDPNLSMKRLDDALHQLQDVAESLKLSGKVSEANIVYDTVEIISKRLKV